MQVFMRRDLWLEDEGLTVLLFALLLMIFIVRPLAAAGVFHGYAGLVADLWLALTLLSGIFAVGWRRKAAQALVFVAVLLFALRALGFAQGTGGTLPEEHNALSAHLTYFSFVSLTTVGYGDILPASLVTRALANFEGLLGTLFPAILIARLVSMEIAAREAKNTKE